MNKKFYFIFFVAIFLGLIIKPGFAVTTSKKRSKESSVSQNEISTLDGIQFVFKAKGAIRSTPAFLNGIAFFGSEDGNLYAINIITGQEKWHLHSAGPVNSSPCLYKNSVYFTSRDGFLRAVSTNKGKELWKFKMGNDLGKLNYWDYFLSSPKIYGNRLYVGGGDGYLYAFDVMTNKLLWKYFVNSRIRTTAAVSGNSVVFGTQDGYVFCLDLKGLLQWKFASDGTKIKFEDFDNDRTSIFCSPAIGNGVVAVGGREGFLYGIDLKTGKQKWKTTQDSASWILSTAIRNNDLFIGGGSAFLVQSLNLQTGKENWRYKTKSAVFSTITLAGDLLYFTDLTGNCYALDSRSGAEQWVFPMAVTSFSAPALKNGLLFCSSDDGSFYALKQSPKTGFASSSAKKIVYWEAPKSETAYNPLPVSSSAYYRDLFVKAGYKLLDANQLKEFMKEQLASSSHSVIVLADNKVPESVVEDHTDKALIRQYLNSGGKIVAFGNNPLAYVINQKTGALDSLDYSIPQKVLGIEYPPRKEVTGLYYSTVTKEGLKWGLKDGWVAHSPVDPKSISAVLTIDEFRQASSWIKNYGGPHGSGWLQITLPREIFDMPSIRKAVEYGITW